MTRRCQISGKKDIVGAKRSHSNIKTLRRFQLNLQSKRVWDEHRKCWVRIRATARALRDLDRKGTMAVLANLK